MKQYIKNQHKIRKNASFTSRRARIPAITYPESLPITAKKDEIVHAIKRHRVVVITGETGSGKTTQIPKMCLEAGRGITGMIGCTQPRRVAAMTVAHRIADEFNEAVGCSVGYQIRFEDRTDLNNYIKIMTDGILLNEAQNDPYLRRYDTIIVDEAHERSLNIDFILGILRTLLSKRKDLKIIITSATIDTEKFSRAFHAPIIEVSGRMYPVEVRYTPIDHVLEESEEITYVDAAVSAVKKLMKEIYRGDVLVFMPTEQDIRETCELIETSLDFEASVLPLFARLPWTEQRQVFQPSMSRKIIVATNIAETSITIPGIKYVIDTGLARISQYNPRLRTTSLPINAISKSSADQRRGRCGRVQNGICIRLYDKDDYDNRPLFTEPEILRSNLAEVILRMLSLGLGDITSFPFIDPPRPKNIRDGIDILKELGAIEAAKEKIAGSDDQRYTLTIRGRMMARLPIDPRISRMIIEAAKEGCVDDILVVAAALSIQDPRERPVELEKEADSIHAGFSDPSSDFLTLIRIWERYHDFLKTTKSKNRMKKFCREHYLSYRRMREWIDVHDQLKEILDEEGWDIKDNRDMSDKIRYDAIHKSILSGYLSNIATKKEKNIYDAAKGKEVMIFPGSGIFNKGGSWIVAADIIETSRHFARTAAVIKAEWLEELGGNLCRSTYSEPHWSRDRGEVVAFEQVSLFGLVIAPRRLVSYGRINPDEASEIFIRSALVEGNVKKPLPFLIYNNAVIERVIQMENKIRKRNLLADEEGIARFYRDRLSNISDLRTLEKGIREKGSDAFLRMTEEDIMQNKPDDELFLFPDEVVIDKHCYPCTYAYEPGTVKDGITLKIPIHMVSALTAPSVDWMIPGLLKDKIFALLKGLPKEYKKQLPPLAHTCATIISEIKMGEDSLLSALSKCINEKFGIDIPASIWVPDGLAEYLRIRFSVVDSKGQEVASSRDIGKLQHDIMKEAESQAFNKARIQWEKTGLISWNFGNIPDAIPLESRGCFEGYAYPGLEAGDGCVHIRLFKNKHDADKSHIDGISALFKIYFRDELKYLKKALTLSGDARRSAEAFCGAKKFENAIYEKVMHDLFCKNIRTHDDFIIHAEHVVQYILPTGQTILNRSIPFLRAYCDCATLFKNSEKTNRVNRPALQYLSIMKMELDNLMPVDFLMRYDNERLTHILRYMKALAIRAERGITHLEKAFSRTEDVKKYSDKYIDMINSVSSGTSEDKAKAIEDYRWMIEEYKVSVFAQELKTASPISKKRLEMKIQEIERMI